MLSASIPRLGNYLRVRGEYLGEVWGNPDLLELPPRARRIHGLDDDFEHLSGTTSACAENTARVR